MPYRFSSTTGNIVRPIESLCLNASTGAIITPLRYGPAGTTITMWNGVVEYYSTLVQAKPTTHINKGFYSPEYAYDFPTYNTSTYGDTTTYANGSTGTGTKEKSCLYDGFQSLSLSGYSSVSLKMVQTYNTYYSQDLGFGAVDGNVTCRISRDSGGSWDTVFSYDAPSSKSDTSIQSYTIMHGSLDNLVDFTVSIAVRPATYYNEQDIVALYQATDYQLYDLWVEVN